MARPHSAQIEGVWDMAIEQFDVINGEIQNLSFSGVNLKREK